MDKNYCKKIDEELLVERYVEGKLNPKEIQKFENHLSECAVHAQAVRLERALYRGISEYARAEIRSRLKRSVEKKDDIRFYILRYAAILFLVVITPLILYYQFYIPQQTDSIQYSEPIPSQPQPSVPIEERITDPANKVETMRKEKSGISIPTTKAKTSEKSVKQSALKGTEVPELIQPAPEVEAQEMELIDDRRVAKKDAIQATETPLSVQSLQKAKSGRQSAGRVAAKSAYEMSAIPESTEQDTRELPKLENELKSCIRRNKSSLNINPFSLSFSFIIDTLGNADDIKFSKISENNSAIDSCLRSTIQNWQFDAPEKNMTVTRQLIVPLE